jgi:hypothetical protein
VLQIQSAASALNPGSDLWIVPQADASRWTLRLDWYLNFQVLKSTRRLPAHIPSELEDIVKEIEWEQPSLQTESDSPILISCEGRLPARWLVVLPLPSEKSEWVRKIVGIWSDLRKPSMKVFLPTGLQAGSFGEEWKRHTDFEDFSLVLDQDPQMQ